MRNLKAVLIMALVILMGLLPMAASASGNVYVGRITKTTYVYNAAKMPVAGLNKGDFVICKPSGKPSAMKVMTESGATGYVYEGYVKYAGTVDSTYVAVTRNDTTVYKIAAGRPYVAMTLEAGVPLVVTNAMNGYARIKSLNGAIGYVKLSNLKHV